MRMMIATRTVRYLYLVGYDDGMLVCLIVYLYFWSADDDDEEEDSDDDDLERGNTNKARR